MKALFFILISLIYFQSFAQDLQEKDKTDILKVLDQQTQAWNKGDLEAFMTGYWNSENLKFYGTNGVTSGWKNTLDRYLKSYPGKDHTGTLKFKINAIEPISEDSYYVMGEFFLTRTVGDANGIFMIIFKKINGDWKIIADTSC